MTARARRQQPLTPEQTAWAIQQYRDGAETTELMRKLDVSRGVLLKRMPPELREARRAIDPKRPVTLRCGRCAAQSTLEELQRRAGQCVNGHEVNTSLGQREAS